jgi:hypothetical protein
MNHVMTLNFNISKQEVCCYVYCFVICITSDSYTTIPVLTMLAQVNCVHVAKYMIMQSQYYNVA